MGQWAVSSLTSQVYYVRHGSLHCAAVRGPITALDWKDGSLKNVSWWRGSVCYSLGWLWLFETLFARHHYFHNKNAAENACRIPSLDYWRSQALFPNLRLRRFQSTWTVLTDSPSPPISRAAVVPYWARTQNESWRRAWHHTKISYVLWDIMFLMLTTSL